VGKTSLVDVLASLVGGSVDVPMRADAEKVKTRLLSPGAVGKRIIRLDNVKAFRFSSGDFEGLITAE
jgi:hypothetical protein